MVELKQPKMCPSCKGSIPIVSYSGEYTAEQARLTYVHENGSTCVSRWLLAIDAHRIQLDLTRTFMRR